MWLVQADQDIGPAPCFIRAKAEDPRTFTRRSCAVTAGHRPRSRGRALLTLTGAERARYQRRPLGASAPFRGYPPVCGPGWLRAKERDPGCAFGPKTIPPATRSLPLSTGRPGPLPSPTPVQPVPRSSPSGHAWRWSGWMQRPRLARARSSRAGHLRPASPVLDRVQKLTAHPGDVNPRNRYFTYTYRGMCGTNHVSMITQRSRIRWRGRCQARAPGARPARARGRRPCRWRWPPPAAPVAPWRPKAPAPGRPGRPRWPRT